MACELICCAGRVFSEQIKGVINEGKPPEEQRHGGYMCVFEGRSVPVPPILLVKIGEQEPSRSLKDAIFCQEKGRRLMRIPDGISSWQTRDPDKAWWGGAIRVERDLIISISGLGELSDEALALKVAFLHGLLTIDRAREIALLSDNMLFFSLVEDPSHISFDQSSVNPLALLQVDTANPPPPKPAA